jgi:hypothetical protein
MMGENFEFVWDLRYRGIRRKGRINRGGGRKDK